MNILHLLRYSVLILLAFSLYSCGWILKDHRYDYLQEKQVEDLKIPENNAARPIVDFYPVPPKGGTVLSSNYYEIPLPPQVFSSGSTNEIRMHKLGELRWLYIEALPSSVWPLMKDFWSSNEYGLSFEDPNIGIIKSKEIALSSSKTMLEMKIEHGIRQASSEIFLSHLMLDPNNSWIKVPVENNLEDKVLRSALDFLSETPSSGGTSLVALNLNLGQKALLKQSDDGTNFIEMDLEFSRAWAAVDRALKEALIVVKDLDREKGIFFVTFKQKEELGFVKSIFNRNERGEQPDFKILIKKVGHSKCIVTVDAESNEAKAFERDLLSEINQSLS